LRTVFAAVLVLFLPIVTLLFTGHHGAAEKLSVAVFVLLSGGIIYTLLLHDEK